MRRWEKFKDCGWSRLWDVDHFANAAGFILAHSVPIIFEGQKSVCISVVCHEHSFHFAPLSAGIKRMAPAPFANFPRRVMVFPPSSYPDRTIVAVPESFIRLWVRVWRLDRPHGPTIVNSVKSSSLRRQLKLSCPVPTVKLNCCAAEHILFRTAPGRSKRW